jgi:hypothetical protein
VVEGLGGEFGFFVELRKYLKRFALSGARGQNKALRSKLLNINSIGHGMILHKQVNKHISSKG